MVIFHFCNDTFGAPFAALSEEFARRERVPIQLVYASTAPSARQRLSRFVRGTAQRLGNPYFTRRYVENVNDDAFLSTVQPGDTGVITGFSQIFKAPAIERFASLANLHPSILPYYRGPAPTHWCVERGERMTGFTLHQITPRIDDGPVLYQSLVEIDASDTRESLARKIGERALPVFEQYLRSLVAGGPWRAVTVDPAGVYARPLPYGPQPAVQDSLSIRAL